MESEDSIQRMRLGVVGAGTMGGGIAQVAAYHGCDVFLVDLSREQIERGLDSIRSSLGRVTGKLGRDGSQRFEETLTRLRSGVDFEVMSEADFVIEAVYEDFQVKADVFRKLDRICRPNVVVASNTSSISITRLASVTDRPQDCIGMHFMNPVPVMKLVEVVRGLETLDSTLEATVALALRLEKVPVESRDFPGFISNRILMPMLNEAMFAVMEGVADVESVDRIMKLGMNHPMGPLQLADLIGLDVCLEILNVLHDGFGDPKYRPCPLLRQMVDAGRLGRKSGRGFYTYTEASPALRADSPSGAQKG